MDPEFPGGQYACYFSWLWKYHRTKVIREYVPKDVTKPYRRVEEFAQFRSARGIEAGDHIRDAFWYYMMYQEGDPEAEELRAKFKERYHALPTSCAIISRKVTMPP